MKALVFISLFWPSLWTSAEVNSASKSHRPVQKVTCTAIRDEPGAPTYAFELIRQRNKKYEARFLDLPGDEQAPPKVVHQIPDLKCRFYTRNRLYFQCQKFGASVESVRIYEDSLSLIADKIQRNYFREIRAIGVDVPNTYIVYRFLNADRCSVKS